MHNVHSLSDLPDPLIHQLSAFLSDGKSITAGVSSGNEAIFVSGFNESARLILRNYYAVEVFHM